MWVQKITRTHTHTIYIYRGQRPGAREEDVPQPHAHPYPQGYWEVVSAPCLQASVLLISYGRKIEQNRLPPSLWKSSLGVIWMGSPPWGKSKAIYHHSLPAPCPLPHLMHTDSFLPKLAWLRQPPVSSFEASSINNNIIIIITFYGSIMCQALCMH